MVVSEESRHRLYTRLEEVLGADEAETLMEHLPPIGWADVATKRDIDALTVATKRDIDTLREATNHRFDALQEATNHRFDALEEATNHRFDTVELRIRHEFADVRHEIADVKRNMATRESVTSLSLSFERELRKLTWRVTVTVLTAVSSLAVAMSVVLAILKA